MTRSHARTPAPRWPTLLALTAAVAGVHLALLLGPVSWTPAAASSPSPTSETAESASARSDSATPEPRSPLVASVSTVRWIVPAAAPEPATASPQAVRKALPVRPASPKPQSRTEAPPVVVEALHQPEQAPPNTTETSANEAPVGTVASADLSAAEPAPETATLEETARDAPAAVPDDDLLAAATAKKRTPAPAATRALPPAQLPASTQLEYAVTGRIKGIAYNAEGQLDWTVADGRYSARMAMKVFLLGSRVQTSTGRVGPAGLSPERFADKSRSEKAAHFDIAQQRIRFSNNAPEAVLLPGAQDRLSLFLQIAGLLQARPAAYASGQTIEMPVVGTGDADIWRFVVGDEVTLSLPAGDMRARLVSRLPRKEFDSTVEMWLAPDLQHLPVRLRVTQANGDVADQQLSRMP